MKFYVFEETDQETNRPYWASYRHDSRMGYLTVSIESADACEAKTRTMLAAISPPKLVKECEL